MEWVCRAEFEAAALAIPRDVSNFHPLHPAVDLASARHGGSENAWPGVVLEVQLSKFTRTDCIFVQLPNTC